MKELSNKNFAEEISAMTDPIAKPNPVPMRRYYFYSYLNSELVVQLHNQARVMYQVPLELSSTTQLEPDFAVLKFREDDYFSAFGTAQDTLLVIEVAEFSLEKDRTQKQQIYAQHGIQEYWIINLKANQLEVYRNPIGEKYHSLQILNMGEAIAPLEFPDTEIRWW